MKYHLTDFRCPLSQILQIINAGEDVKKRMWKKSPHSYTVGGNVNCSHYGEQYEGSLKKLKTELPYDQAIPLLCIYLEKTLIWKDTCIPVFTAALFTIAKTWKQPKQQPDRRMNKENVGHIYNGIPLNHKKERNNAICSNVNGHRDYMKWSKFKREREVPFDIAYMWNLQYDTKELIYKAEIDSQRDQTCCLGGGERKRDGLRVWVW